MTRSKRRLEAFAMRATSKRRNSTARCVTMRSSKPSSGTLSGSKRQRTWSERSKKDSLSGRPKRNREKRSVRRCRRRSVYAKSRSRKNKRREERSRKRRSVNGVNLSLKS